jgi:hypothetical protein
MSAPTGSRGALCPRLGRLIGLRWACDHPAARAHLRDRLLPDGIAARAREGDAHRGRGRDRRRTTREAFGQMLAAVAGIDEQAIDEYFKAYADLCVAGQLELCRRATAELEPYRGRAAPRRPDAAARLRGPVRTRRHRPSARAGDPARAPRRSTASGTSFDEVPSAPRDRRGLPVAATARLAPDWRRLVGVVPTVTGREELAQENKPQRSHGHLVPFALLVPAPPIRGPRPRPQLAACGESPTPPHRCAGAVDYATRRVRARVLWPAPGTDPVHKIGSLFINFGVPAAPMADTLEAAGADAPRTHHVSTSSG